MHADVLSRPDQLFAFKQRHTVFTGQTAVSHPLSKRQGRDAGILAKSFYLVNEASSGVTRHLAKQVLYQIHWDSSVRSSLLEQSGCAKLMSFTFDKHSGIRQTTDQWLILKRWTRNHQYIVQVVNSIQTLATPKHYFTNVYFSHKRNLSHFLIKHFTLSWGEENDFWIIILICESKRSEHLYS